MSKSWTKRGVARTAGLTFALCILAVGVIGGFTGAGINAKTTKPTTVLDLRPSFVTIGCDPGRLALCTDDQMIAIINEWWDDSENEWLYKIGYKSVSMGYIEPVLRHCPAITGTDFWGRPIYYHPPWRKGDHAMFIRYEDHPEEGCISILPDAAGTMLKRTNGKTESEVANVR